MGKTTMKKRCLKFEAVADQVLKNLPSLLFREGDPLINKVAGDLKTLLFEVPPDANDRKDISPVGVGRYGKDYTRYQADFGSIKVEYSTSMTDVIVHSLELPSLLMIELAMVA